MYTVGILRTSKHSIAKNMVTMLPFEANSLDLYFSNDWRETVYCVYIYICIIHIDTTFLFGIILLCLSVEFSSRSDYSFFEIGKLVWESSGLNFHLLYSNFLPGSSSWLSWPLVPPECACLCSAGMGNSWQLIPDSLGALWNLPWWIAWVPACGNLRQLRVLLGFRAA